MTAAPKAKPVDREGPVHRAILAYLRAALPGAVIHHSPNEIGVAPQGKSAEAIKQFRRSKAIAQQKAKRLGMLPGFPDLLIIWCGAVWAIEVKAPGSSPAPEQRAVGADIEAMGGRWGVARSVDEAAALVRGWKEQR